MFTLYFVAFCFVFCLNFIFSFILHPSCIFILVHFFISCPHFSLTLCLFVTKRERVYSREYTGELCHFYMILMHILKGRNSISCTFVEGEITIGEMHIPRGRRHFFLENLVLFCFTLCLLSCCFMVLWVMFNIYALLLSLYHAYVLDMHTSLCYCALLVACLDDHCSYFHMTVLCLIKLFICFTTCLLYVL